MLAKFSLAIVVLGLSTWSFSQKADKRIEAQQWIETQIPKAFNSQLNPIESLATATYQDYKSDAINVDFDCGLTEAAFQEKWKKEFNTNKAGIGSESRTRSLREENFTFLLLVFGFIQLF